MKITMENGTVVLTSENQSEGMRMVDMYYNRKVVTKPVEASKSTYGLSSFTALSKTHKKYKKVCPECGEKFKNLSMPIIAKHRRNGKVGWHITGISPTKKKDHPDLIDAL